MTKLYSRRHGLLFLWLFALVAFHFPWTSHFTTAFTQNAFDLAEQIRYHPAIVAESPTLRSSMLLWVGIPLLAVGIAFTGSLYEKWYIRGLIQGFGLLVVIRVIPPQEKIRNGEFLTDNYAFALTLLTLLGMGLIGLIILFRRFLWKRLWLYEALLLITGILPLVGYYRAYRLLHELGLEVSLGAGMVFYSFAIVMLLALCVKWDWQPNKRAAVPAP